MDVILWTRKYILVPFLRLTYFAMSKNTIQRFFDIEHMSLLNLDTEVLALSIAVMRFSR